jgi:hypothetical protein
MEKISPKLAAAFGVGFLGFIMAAYSYNKHHKPEYADNLVKHFSDDMERSIKEDERNTKDYDDKDDNNDKNDKNDKDDKDDKNDKNDKDDKDDKNDKNEDKPWGKFWKGEYENLKNKGTVK